jgi:hypothetical protein
VFRLLLGVAAARYSRHAGTSRTTLITATGAIPALKSVTMILDISSGFVDVAPLMACSETLEVLTLLGEAYTNVAVALPNQAR